MVTDGTQVVFVDEGQEAAVLEAVKTLQAAGIEVWAATMSGNGYRPYLGLMLMNVEVVHHKGTEKNE
jgi:hypothetical protein